MRNAQINILNASSSSVSQIGSAIDVNQVVSASFQAVFGGSIGGTVKIQCSNDLPTNERQLFVPTNWSDIPNATSTITAGAGPAIVIGNMCFSYIRAVWTYSSGSATTVVVNMNVLSC